MNTKRKLTKVLTTNFEEVAAKVQENLLTEALNEDKSNKFTLGGVKEKTARASNSN